MHIRLILYFLFVSKGVFAQKRIALVKEVHYDCTSIGDSLVYYMDRVIWDGFSEDHYLSKGWEFNPDSTLKGFYLDYSSDKENRSLNMRWIRDEIHDPEEVDVFILDYDSARGRVYDYEVFSDAYYHQFPEISYSNWYVENDSFYVEFCDLSDPRQVFDPYLNWVEAHRNELDSASIPEIPGITDLSTDKCAVRSDTLMHKYLAPFPPDFSAQPFLFDHGDRKPDRQIRKSFKRTEIDRKAGYEKWESIGECETVIREYYFRKRKKKQHLKGLFIMI